MSIFTSAVEKPITTLMVFLAVVVIGIFSYLSLPIDQYPKMDPPYITVMATYPGANASDIEQNVTKILEDNLNSVDDLKEIQSVSYDNLTVVTLEFEWGIDLDNAANDASKYSLTQLKTALGLLSDADRRLKSTNEAPQTILEELILRLLRV